MLIPSSTEVGATGEVAANVTIFMLCETGPCHTLCCKFTFAILKLLKETIGRSVSAVDHQVSREGAWKAFMLRDKDPYANRQWLYIGSYSEP